MATVLAIETSCDETGVAIVKNRQVLSNVVASQIETHRLYGGVVPEVASRQHLEGVNLAIAQAVTDANLTWSEIDAIAGTCAPGLIGALLVGLTAAKTLAIVHDKPFIGVHHLEGHIYASYLSEPTLEPPFLCLLVSGGHTSLIQVKDCGRYTVLGQTRDDAAGEAFDKVARLLKLGYPGGPIVDRLAATGNPQAFALPEGQIRLPQGGVHPYDSSFSGLKTAVLRLVQNLSAQNLSAQDAGAQNWSAQNLSAQNLSAQNVAVKDPELPIADLAASFQFTVAKALTKRAIACAQDFGLTTIAVGGGVAANQGLRQHLRAAAAPLGIRVLFPPMKYCTDNAAMIACAAAEHFDRGHVSSLSLNAQSRMSIEQVMSLYPS
jgi:N6-L-threonylcarbamoyladenine synthase